MCYQDRNGVVVNKNDKVKLVGKPNAGQNAEFTTSMSEMLNDGRVYTISELDTASSSMKYIRIEGWWFRTMFVEKISTLSDKNISPYKTKPAMFDIKQLVT